MPPRLAILADDLTGALDTGAQFSARGLETRIFWRAEAMDGASGADVAVFNMRCRHKAPAEAAEIARACVRQAQRLGARQFFLKTDSALRGHIGACMEALVQALDCGVYFVPAYPAAGRVVRGGALWIDGIPVSQSAYGADPQNPVRHDAIAEILREETQLPIAFDRLPTPREKCICLQNAWNQAQMDAAAKQICALGAQAVWAGCAGLAEALAQAWVPGAQSAAPFAPRPGAALLVSGSVHAAAFTQLARLQGVTQIPFQPFAADGVAKAAQSAAQALRQGHTALLAAALSRPEADAIWQKGLNAGFAPQALSAHLAHSLASAASAALALCLPQTLLVVGGDTLEAILEAAGAHALRVLRPLGDGVILNEMDCAAGRVALLTKSGGLGGESALERIVSHR